VAGHIEGVNVGTGVVRALEAGEERPSPRWERVEGVLRRVVRCHEASV
jgi:hypothetical protein